MPLNKSKGDMYSFVTHTWNTVKGTRPHDCEYCYMKQFKQNDIRLDRKEFKTDLGKGDFIFVGSSCDMWADAVSEEWIVETLKHCNLFYNRYLYQSKNPLRMFKLRRIIKEGSVLGTTIETNRRYNQMGDTPSPNDRAVALHLLSTQGFKTMVTIEPIMDFDLLQLLNLIGICNPEWINIGADSKNHVLPEPDKYKLSFLIKHLRQAGHDVKIKSNLKRLMPCTQ